MRAPVLGASLCAVSLALVAGCSQPSSPEAGASGAPSAPASPTASSQPSVPSVPSEADVAADVEAAVLELTEPGPDARITSRVFLASTGVPFTVQEFVLPCEPYDPAAARAALGTMHERTGGDVVVYVVPDKSSIRRDALGAPADRLMQCSDRVREQTEKAWPEGDPALVTLWSRMALAESARPRSTYPDGNSHWTPQGARLFSADLVQRLEAQGLLPEGAWKAARIRQSAPTAVPSSLFASIGMERADDITGERAVRRGVTTTSTQKPGAGNPTLEFRSTTTGPALVPGRTVIVRDSFIWNALPHLAPFFERLTVMHWTEFADRVEEGTLPRADRYVFETVQRGWVARAALLSAPAVQDAVTAAAGG